MEEQLTVPELRNTMRHLLDLAECPVCRKIPRSDCVNQCFNGHVVCTSCRFKLPSCPVCRGVFDCTKPIVFAKLLDILPKQCTNEGCSELLGNIEHEFWCGFREWICWWCEESKFYVGSQMLTHIEENHQDKLVRNNDNDQYDITVENFCKIVEGETSLPSLEKDIPKFVELVGEMFFVSYWYNGFERCLKVRIGLIPRGAPPTIMNLFGTLELSAEDGTHCSLSKLFNINHNFDLSPMNVRFDIPESILNDYAGKTLRVKTSISSGTNV